MVTARKWLARHLADQALARGHDQAFAPDLRAFFYLPFQHSEALADQDRALALFEAAARESGDPDYARWARHHHGIIARFGRFPHRNAALGRPTKAEKA